MVGYSPQKRVYTGQEACLIVLWIEQDFVRRQTKISCTIIMEICYILMKIQRTWLVSGCSRIENLVAPCPLFCSCCVSTVSEWGRPADSRESKLSSGCRPDRCAVRLVRPSWALNWQIKLFSKWNLFWLVDEWFDLWTWIKYLYLWGGLEIVWLKWSAEHLNRKF